jgi:uroporphyrinogen decarboxylase
MNSRERVFAALERRETDRPPFNLRLTAEACRRFRAATGADDGDFEAYLGCDLRRVCLRLPPKPEELPRSEWFPEPSADAVAGCAAEAEWHRQAGLATYSGYVCGVFEEAKEWAGDEALLVMPYEDPERLSAMLERITALKMTLYGAYARAGLDIVHIGDDLGAQSSLIMSPEQYRQWYRPRHRQIIGHLRSIRPDVLIAFHCCGHVTPLIPDLIELGVDILEAVQPEAMDLAGLKREFGRDIAFWGGVGNQSVLARLTPGEVAASVRRTIALMAPGGGYLASPCHTVTEDIPWDNVMAFVRAAKLPGR